MSHERISPDDPQAALNCYFAAVPLLKAITSDIQPSLHTQATGDPGSFARYRELWRWTERLLRRAIVVSAKVLDLGRTADRHMSVWTMFGFYRLCSSHWPPSFRPNHRSVVLVLHLRAFTLQARALTPAVASARDSKWMSVARSAVQEYRNMLSASTSFPRAGERNVKVEDFVDLCVAVWEADGAIGEYAGWVTDVSNVACSWSSR